MRSFAPALAATGLVTGMAFAGTPAVGGMGGGMPSVNSSNMTTPVAPTSSTTATATPVTTSTTSTKAPTTLETIAAIDVTGVVKPLSKMQVGTYKCVTPWQNVEYAISTAWHAYKLACKLGLRSAYTTVSAANPVVGGLLLSTCTVPQLYEGAAKLVDKVSGPKGFASIEGIVFKGATRWFLDKGWFSAELMKDDDIYVTIGRERTPAQAAHKVKLAKAIVNVCSVGIDGTAAKPNGDWDVKPSSCNCQKFTFDDKSPVDIDNKVTDQLIVPMKKMRGNLLHIFIDGRKGNFKYSVALSKTPAESPAVLNPVVASAPPAPTPATTTPTH